MCKNDRHDKLSWLILHEEDSGDTEENQSSETPTG